MINIDNTHSTHVSLVAVAFGLMLCASACFQGDSDNDVCPDGNSGCPCYGNGTCNNNMVCDNNMCQRKETSGSLGTGGSNSTSTPQNTQEIPTMEELVAGCALDLTCVNTDDTSIKREGQVSRQGEDCVLYVPNISTALHADGTTDDSYYPTWSFGNGVLAVCNETGRCMYFCDIDGNVDVHCGGEASKCDSLPPDECAYVEGCSMENEGCEGYALRCERYGEKTACEKQGCWWTD